MKDRKTTVKFNHDNQKWEVLEIKNQKILLCGAFNTRQEARDYKKARQVQFNNNEKGFTCQSAGETFQ